MKHNEQFDRIFGAGISIQTSEIRGIYSFFFATFDFFVATLDFLLLILVLLLLHFITLHFIYYYTPCHVFTVITLEVTTLGFV